MKRPQRTQPQPQQQPQQRRQKRRGYLLLETLIGGALTATVLVPLYLQLGATRAESISVARDMTAETLVTARLEAAQALPFASIAAATEATVTGMNANYKRVLTVASGSETLRGQVVAYKDVTVTVTFTGAAAQVRSRTATVRIYDL